MGREQFEGKLFLCDLGRCRGVEIERDTGAADVWESLNSRGIPLHKAIADLDILQVLHYLSRLQALAERDHLDDRRP